MKHLRQKACRVKVESEPSLVFGNMFGMKGLSTLAKSLSRANKISSTIARSSSNYSSPDVGFEKDRIMKAPGEANQRDFTYFLLGGGRFVYASAARLALIKVSRYRPWQQKPSCLYFNNYFLIFIFIFLYLLLFTTYFYHIM